MIGLSICIISLSFTLLLLLTVSTNAFNSINKPYNRHSYTHKKQQQTQQRHTLSMFFGGAKKVVNTKIIITVDGKIIESDEKNVNLRKELIANKVDVYPLRAKITGNCGGAGICGTCAVKVIDGAANINPPSKNELNTLRGKPSDQRLSCCAKVTGPITIKTKP